MAGFGSGPCERCHFAGTWTVCAVDAMNTYMCRHIQRCACIHLHTQVPVQCVYVVYMICSAFEGPRTFQVGKLCVNGVYTHMHANMCLDMCAHTHMCMCIYIYVHVHIYIYTYTENHVHLHICVRKDITRLAFFSSLTVNTHRNTNLYVVLYCCRHVHYVCICMYMYVYIYIDMYIKSCPGHLPPLQL